jgi:hypothetical protein
MIQAIVYSVATGRVRRVLDPEAAVPNVLTFLAECGAGTGEAAMAYTKQGNGLDTAVSWQAVVNAHTGLSVAFPANSSATDWYCGVDGSNVIKWWGLADPACGDSFPDLTLVNAPFGADSRWTYNGATFTAPILVKTKA